MGQQWPAAGSGALSAAVHAWDLLKEVPLSSLPPPQFGFRSSNREGTQPHPSIENWIKDLLSMAPPIRARPTFPHSQSFPSESFYKPLIHQRPDRMETTYHRNIMKLTTWIISSVQFSRSVLSDSLRPHESQHAMPPCSSPTPGVHSDSGPSSQ